jgi:hypothetical protein
MALWGLLLVLLVAILLRMGLHFSVVLLDHWDLMVLPLPGKGFGSDLWSDLLILSDSRTDLEVDLVVQKFQTAGNF